VPDHVRAGGVRRVEDVLEDLDRTIDVEWAGVRLG
jgi:hypothetical protein